MSGTTGQHCQISGVYRCSTHTSNTIPLAVRNVFPPCSVSNGHGTTWILVQRAQRLSYFTGAGCFVACPRILKREIILMQQITRRFQCRECSHVFERDVLETVVTLACPRCRPIVSLLERLGMTPEQAITITLVGFGLIYLAKESN